MIAELVGNEPTSTTRITSVDYEALTILLPNRNLKKFSNFSDIKDEITIDYGLTDIMMLT